MARVFILGWDGATFDLIRPWVAEGKLPNIARLMREGVHGPLASTIPPMTFPIWSSFLTGKNPGKHGIYDFTRPRPGRYQVEFVNGGLRRAASFWSLLSRAGRQSISISIPCTYPPEKVNGVMISGFDAPGPGAGGVYVSPSGIHPPEMYEELNRNVGPHPIGAFVLNVSDINHGKMDEALDTVLHTIRAKAATAKYLLTHRPWDCGMILFGESDGASHQFWKYCDPASPLYQDQPSLRDSIFRVYQQMDQEAGELLACLPPDTVVLMMSDHGFGGVSNWVVYPNCRLREQGMLRFRGGLAHWRSRVLDAVKLRAVASLPGFLKSAVYRVLRQRGLGNIESRVRFGMIDWSGTEAYFEENPYYPVVWINLKGRQPKGTVEPGRHYEQVRDRVIEALESWRHPETGERVVDRAYRREEVYSGPFLNEAPDIVPRWASHRGYSYVFRLSSKSRRLASLEQVDPNAPQHLPFFTGKSGSHRENGIFVAQGPGVRAGMHVDGTRIVDLAPTILHLLGVPVPDDMDGTVLQNILTDSHHREVAVQRASTNGHHTEEREGYSAEEEEMVSQRLKALGYTE